jgi:hypothetical protein
MVGKTLPVWPQYSDGMENGLNCTEKFNNKTNNVLGNANINSKTAELRAINYLKSSSAVKFP